MHNQGLLQQDKATESMQSLLRALATLSTQFSQQSFAEQFAQTINNLGGVFLIFVFIGYIFGELRSVKYRVKRVAAQHSQVIGTFSNRKVAGQALDHLVLSGFLLAKVFLVGKDSTSNKQPVDAEIMKALVYRVHAGLITGTVGLRKGVAIGKVSGGLIGLLLGLTILALLGIERIALGSAVGFTLLLSGVCTAIGGIIGALVSLRMTKKRTKKYVERVANGDYLIIVNGTTHEIERAKRILNKSNLRTLEERF